MSTWHHPTCRKPDVAIADGIPTCKSCGLVYICNRKGPVCELHVAVSCTKTGPAELSLAWPSTVTFSQPESLPADSEVRHQLETLAEHKGQEWFQRAYICNQSLNADDNSGANGVCPQSIDGSVHPEYDTQNSCPPENLHSDHFEMDDTLFNELLERDFQNEVGSLMDILALDLENWVRRPIDKRLRRKQGPRKLTSQNDASTTSRSQLKHQLRVRGPSRRLSSLPWPRFQSKQALGAQDDQQLGNEDQFLKLYWMYEDLGATDQIRLLYLSPSPNKAANANEDQAQPLHGYLRHARLSSRPKFTALSYTWASESGDRRMTDNIFLGDCWEPLAITSNCAGALRQLRHPTETRVLWVDAVCINQVDAAEKTRQVAMMRYIYSSADLVKIYLGWDGSYTKGGLRRVRDSLFCDGNAPRLTQADNNDIEALFSRSYWSRIWVVQEVFLAKEAVVLIGNSSIPLTAILSTAFTSYLPTWVCLAQDPQGRKTCPLGNAESLSELLFATSSCNSSDPRDRIFALLGLVQGSKMEGLVADYSRTAAEIYTGLTAYFLIKHGQFGILRLAAIENSRHIVVEDDTQRHFAVQKPSWVPVWEYSLRKDLDYVEQRLVDRLIEFWSYPEYIWDKERRKWLEKRTMRALLESLTPTCPSRQIRMHFEDVNPAPRVFQGSGALLIRAYCVLDLDVALHGGGFMSIRPGTGLIEKHQGNPLGWDIHVLSYLASVECLDRVIEVPNCGSFLHVKPDTAVSGAYRIASMCHIAFVANKHPGQVPLLPYHNLSSMFELRRLLARLVPFQYRDLQYLQDWSLAMRANTSLVPLRAGKDTDPSTQVLSTTEMDKYQQWLVLSLTQHHDPTFDDQEVTPDDLSQILEKLWFLLDEWQDLYLWRRICGLLDAVDWHQYLIFLDDMRLRLCQHFLDGSPKDDLDVSRLYQNIVKRKLDQLLIDVSGVIPFGDDQLYFGDLALSEAVADLCNDDVVEAYRNTEFWVGEAHDVVSHSWTKLSSFLQHMVSSQRDSRVMMEKFTQRQLLLDLYTRRKLQEFLIH